MSAPNAPSVLIVGCGDVGTRLAQRLREQQHRVIGVVRRPERRAQLADAGIVARAVDLDSAPDAAVAALSAPWVLWLAPPPGSGLSDTRLRRWLALATLPQRLVYLSTPAVYGNCDGRWIDENEPFAPLTERGQRRADAECAVLEAASRAGFEAVRVRVPGIYGPGRLPVERLRSRHPVVVESEAPWSNRIHVDDLVTALIAALRRGEAGAVYHASDGHPSTMTDWFVACARALEIAEPPRVPLAEAMRSFSPALKSYLAESRRLDNRRMREELGVQLRYPTLADGLRAILAADEAG